ncbi:hypothetical protein [Chenggangzhangella methanolivorans]|uniref:hypothetical protein n=1 Tax=Chenggangzhangella methanolivorans TaxID=1437009 RepID=UPI0021BD4447|nr:hypothetical protein [Chenggangzhangella methanolivorans]
MSDGYSAAQLRAIDPEVKEAVCDALANLVVDRVSGADAEGRVIFGRSPRRAIVSGQLLPRFNDGDNPQDETSDIRIAAIGLDFTVRSGVEGNLTVRPRASVYVRALPSWQELQDPRNGLEIDFRLRAAIQADIDQTIRTRRQELFAAQGLQSPAWRDLSETDRAGIRGRRAAIQEQVRIEAYRRHRIELVRGDLEAEATVPAQDGPDVEAAPPEQDAEPRPQIAALLRSQRLIPYEHIDPAPLPGKWIRVPLALPEGTMPLAVDDAAFTASVEAYGEQLRLAAAASVAAWLGSEEGGRSTWRNVAIRPGDAQSEATYGAFLAAVRGQNINPADVAPDLTQLTFTAERQRDFLDPSVASYRLTLDNRAQEPPIRQALKRCHACSAARSKSPFPGRPMFRFSSIGSSRRIGFATSSSIPRSD